MLESLAGFCFCGEEAIGERLNAIESLQTDSQERWRTLPLNRKVAECFHLAGVSFKGSILVFGGRSYSSKHTYVFSEEGKLSEDVSEGKLIPEKMSCGSCVLSGGKVFAVGDTAY